MVYAVNMLVRPKAVTVSQITNKKVESAMEIYIQNAIVCLGSVIDQNPQIKALLCTNFDLPQPYDALCRELGIEIRYVEFRLEVASHSNWSICNYRYCVMEHLCGTLLDEDVVMMLDTDIICVDALGDLLDDVQDDILLYDVCHDRTNRDRKNILLNYRKIYGQDTNLIHYGGEFICTRVENLKKLHRGCLEVIAASNEYEDLLNFNDEHITSMAVYRELRNKAHPVGAYLCRYWTGSFYLASTNWKNNPVPLWHLPAEKQTGICWTFRYFRKYRRFPEKKTLARKFGLPRAHRPDRLRYLLSKLCRRLKNR